jgi:hypothetical protein
LATLAPAAAATSALAVETLNFPDPVPPVPQVSTNRCFDTTTGNFLDGFALRPQTNEKSSCLRICRVAGHDNTHDLNHFITTKILSINYSSYGGWHIHHYKSHFLFNFLAEGSSAADRALV